MGKIQLLEISSIIINRGISNYVPRCIYNYSQIDHERSSLINDKMEIFREKLQHATQKPFEAEILIQTCWNECWPTNQCCMLFVGKLQFIRFSDLVSPGSRRVRNGSNSSAPSPAFHFALRSQRIGHWCFPRPTKPAQPLQPLWETVADSGPMSCLLVRSWTKHLAMQRIKRMSVAGWNHLCICLSMYLCIHLSNLVWFNLI